MSENNFEIAENGPPSREQYSEGDVVTDVARTEWRLENGQWKIQRAPYVWVVVDSAGIFQMPRAWVFQTEEEAVKFRCEKVEMYSRRTCSLSPVFRCRVNGTLPGDANEIDWKKYQLPKQEKKKKFQ